MEHDSTMCLWAPHKETERWEVIDKDGSLSSIFKNANVSGPKDSQLKSYGITRIPPWGVMDYFVFHEVCWNRIMDHFDPRQSLDAFYTALEHIPLPDGMFRVCDHKSHCLF